MNIEPVSRAYINMRDAKRKLEDEIKQIEEQMEQLAAVMLSELKQQQATSINNDVASIQYVRRVRYYSSEMPAFRQFAKEHDALDLFENRLHQGNITQWLEEHPDIVPPGLQADTKETVKVVAK